jgi:hypothetical protein
MAVRRLLLLVLLPLSALGQQTCDPGAEAASVGRFEPHPDGTVTDLRARLTWNNVPERYAWEDAKHVVQQINASGRYFYDDWRLPTLRELATITELHCRDPRINLSTFPQTRADFYWSASTKLIDGPELTAYAMNFGAQGFQPRRLQETSFVRMVRTALD